MKEKEEQILIGSLLGDGHMELPNTNPRFTEAHSIKQKDYILWKVDNLPFFFSIYKREVDKHKIIQARTHCIPQLKKFYEKTFEEKIKKIELLGFLIWYLDDGCYQYMGEYLTLGNAKHPNEKIIEWGKDKLGVRFKTGEYDYLRLNVVDSRKILPKLINTFDKYDLPQSISYKLGLDKERRKRSREVREEYREKKRDEYREYLREYYEKNKDKITQTEWSDEEIKVLKENYKKKTDKELSLILDRTKGAINTKRHKIGLLKEGHNEGWESGEIEFLKEKYEHMTDKKMGNHLDKSEKSVGYKRRELGLRKYVRWTEEEIKFLKENYKNMEDKEISNKLGKTINSIRSKRDRMGLKKRWTDEEVRFLKENYKDKTDEEISNRLEKTPKAISSKRYRLGLIKREQKI